MSQSKFWASAIPVNRVNEASILFRIFGLLLNQEMDVRAFALLWVGWLAVVLGLISVTVSRC